MPKTTKTDKAISVTLSSDNLWVIVADSETEPKYLTIVEGWTLNTEEAILFQSLELAERFHSMTLRNRSESGDKIVTLTSLQSGIA